MTRAALVPLLFLLLIAAFLFAPHTPAAAQGGGEWADGCAPQARQVIDPTNTRYAFDLNAACAAYRACDPAGDGDFACQMAAADLLWAQCAPDDAHCQRTALLYAAGILAFDEPFGESMGYVPPDALISGYPAMLAAFQADDYAGALAALPPDTAVENPDPFFSDPSDTSRYAALPYARGVVHTQAGDARAALAELDAALAIDPALPLAYVSRADAYGALGRTLEAAADALWLSNYVADRPAAGPELIAAVVAQYPLEPGQAERWRLYALLTQNAGPGGTFYTDLTYADARPVQVTFDPAGQFVIVAGAGSTYAYQSGGDGEPGQPNVLVLRADGEAFRWQYDNSAYGSSAAMTLTPRSNGTYYGVEFQSFFEGYVEWNFVLAPLDTPISAADVDGMRCEGGVISRVRPGMTVNGAGFAYEEVIALYDNPNGSVIASTDPWGEFTILAGGPLCDGGSWWWPASTGGVTGWVRENVDQEYVINPANPDAQRLFYCPDAPETRLAAGIEAQVVTGLGANNVRDAASTDGAVVGALAEGSQFSVTGGPICADGFAWWQVEQGDLVGWTAEGDAASYWLAPLGQ